jgi:hypothetical protein
MSYARRRVVLFGAVVFTFLALPIFAAGVTRVISPLAVPSISFTATPDDIATGETSTLVWDTTNATSVTIAPGLGSEPLSGSATVQPSVSTTYTLTATGPGGSSTSQVTVTVVKRPIIAFFVRPEHIVAGETAMLIWSVSNSFSVSIDQGIGPVPASGSLSISPTSPTTYTMTAVGVEGNTVAEATIDVVEVPHIDFFTATPSTISPGDSATLEWSVSGIHFITIDPIGDFFENGSTTVSPKKTTVYRLTATNAAGTDTATVTVTVPVPVQPKHRAVRH